VRVQRVAGGPRDLGGRVTAVSPQVGVVVVEHLADSVQAALPGCGSQVARTTTGRSISREAAPRQGGRGHGLGSGAEQNPAAHQRSSALVGHRFDDTCVASTAPPWFSA